MLTKKEKKLNKKNITINALKIDYDDKYGYNYKKYGFSTNYDTESSDTSSSEDEDNDFIKQSTNVKNRIENSTKFKTSTTTSSDESNYKKQRKKRSTSLADNSIIGLDLGFTQNYSSKLIKFVIGEDKKIKHQKLNQYKYRQYKHNRQLSTNLVGHLQTILYQTQLIWIIFQLIIVIIIWTRTSENLRLTNHKSYPNYHPSLMPWLPAYQYELHVYLLIILNIFCFFHIPSVIGHHVYILNNFTNE